MYLDIIGKSTSTMSLLLPNKVRLPLSFSFTKPLLISEHWYITCCILQITSKKLCYNSDSSCYHNDWLI